MNDSRPKLILNQSSIIYEEEEKKIWWLESEKVVQACDVWLV
jgi:hypothetical protein